MESRKSPSRRTNSHQVASEGRSLVESELRKRGAGLVTSEGRRKIYLRASSSDRSRTVQILKRCTKSSSNLRFYEETMCCKLDSAPEPISPGATHRSSPCCVATPRSRIVDPVPHRFWFTGGL